MAIDKKTVDKIAHLARLEFESEAKDEIVNDMNRMLLFVEKLNEVNTENIKPLIYMTEEQDTFREDIVKDTVSHKDALLNAPKKDSDYFKAPKVLTKK